MIENGQFIRTDTCLADVQWSLDDSESGCCLAVPLRKAELLI